MLHKIEGCRLHGPRVVRCTILFEGRNAYKCLFPSAVVARASPCERSRINDCKAEQGYYSVCATLSPPLLGPEVPVT